MIFQRDRENPVWGTAEPGESVTVSFGGQEVRTTGGQDGKWQVKLKPMAGSSDPQTLKITGKNQLVFDDVLVGEVWICSGQSNMGLPVQRTTSAGETALQPSQLRLFKTFKTPAFTPQETLKGSWTEATPEAIATFPAAAYFFGRQIQETQKVPVGLVASFRGATPGESWTRLEVLQANPAFKSYVEDFEKARAAAAQAPAAPAAEEQDNAAANANATGARGPFQTPCVLFNGMINPLIPFGMRGVIWYQGENNAKVRDDAALYETLFPAMIADWRKLWGQGDFPFLFVQLASWKPGVNWPWLRNAQLKSLALPNTAMAVTIDIGDERDIHPKNKLDVGLRLALAARNLAYGEKIEFSGPIFSGLEIKDGRALVAFDHLGGGLCTARPGAPGEKPSPIEEEVSGFEIAGPDGAYVRAQAKIEGDRVAVWSNAVKNPSAVRYAWTGFPKVNLYNLAGLPASPFASDDSPALPPKKS